VSRRRRLFGSIASVRIVDVELDVDALAGLSTHLACAFAARRGFSGDGGAK
jgi:hypothetical protein